MREKVYLASKSPRRLEILKKFNLEVNVVENKFNEDNINIDNPRISTMVSAFNKALSVEKNLEKGSLIISADTVLYYDGDIIGKPKNLEEARKTLEKLSGKRHSVITGFSIIKAQESQRIIDYVESFVEFKDLSDIDIDRYLETEEYIDKAGAYGIQGYGGLLVKKIDGCYFNIVGLPISRIDTLLKSRFNIDLLK